VKNVLFGQRGGLVNIGVGGESELGLMSKKGGMKWGEPDCIHESRSSVN